MALAIAGVLLLIIAIFALVYAWRLMHETTMSIRKISDALQDIKNGNGNRRILSDTHAPEADIIFSINDIVEGYETRLAVCEKNEEINRQLMTSLSHDIRTPLTTLLGYLDAIHKGLAVGEEADEYTERARIKAHDVKEYIDTLFDWMKLYSDEYYLDMNEQDMTALTRTILIDWIPVLEEKHLKYKMEIPDQEIMVLVDKREYGRILGNLIQNVLEHSRASCLAVSLTKEDGQAILSVKDNGTGISREDLAHIFDRLFKADASRSGKGNGLGLSIAQELTEKMNGTIAAESCMGKGTIFTLSFPLIRT